MVAQTHQKKALSESNATEYKVAEVLGATLHVEIQRKKHPKQVRLRQIAEAKSNYGVKD